MNELKKEVIEKGKLEEEVLDIMDDLVDMKSYSRSDLQGMVGAIITKAILIGKELSKTKNDKTIKKVSDILDDLTDECGGYQRERADDIIKLLEKELK